MRLSVTAPLLAAAATALLSACAPVPVDCASAARRDVIALDQLIAEAEGNIARGYALDAPRRAASNFSFCLGGGGDTVGVMLCNPSDRHATTARSGPVAIDLQAEARKLAQLKQKRAERAAAQSACPAP